MLKLKIRTSINYEAIAKKIGKAAELKGRPQARKRSYDLFYRAKTKMLRKFDEDYITLELAAGPEYSVKNISGTLDGYGNLFSFLGFNHGDKPIEVLRNILKSRTHWDGIPHFDGKRWTYNVIYPSRQTIEQEGMVKLPWTDTPWIDFIERGAPNINHYLNLKKRDTTGRSFSWYGLQAAVEVNEDLEFKERDYITHKILGNFRDTINDSSIQD